MSTRKITFSGVTIRLCAGWRDITHELEHDSPFTLARSAKGIGALQFSVARYKTGMRPNVKAGDLREMLVAFGDVQDLGSPSNVKEYLNGKFLVSGDFSSDIEFIRIWYVSNGSDIIFVSYVTQEIGSSVLSRELSEAESIVQSIDLGSVV